MNLKPSNSELLTLKGVFGGSCSSLVSGPPALARADPPKNAAFNSTEEPSTAVGGVDWLRFLSLGDRNLVLGGTCGLTEQEELRKEALLETTDSFLSSRPMTKAVFMGSPPLPFKLTGL